MIVRELKEALNDLPDWCNAVSLKIYDHSLGIDIDLIGIGINPYAGIVEIDIEPNLDKILTEEREEIQRDADDSYWLREG